jgi:hypothetical protein
MKLKRIISTHFYQFVRQSMAMMVCLMLIPLGQADLFAQAPPPPAAAYTPLDAATLDQLVAPIALYPDSLVAQVLTAATYPDQVSDADNWVHQNAGLPPAQIAAGANGMNWDPSVKALTAFPSVLDNLARNSNWTSQLGNAYYNQPEDVMNAVQAMRYQAQQSGALVSTPQQRVYVDSGAIVIAPVNPALVYVPYYNPWRVWGPGFVVAYPGYYIAPPPPGIVLGVGLGFAAGISIGFWGHYGWGWGAWAPSWRGGVVLFNHGAYYSRSVTVYNHGHWGGYNRGVFEHGGRGVPGGFHAAAMHGAYGHPGPAGRGYAGRPEPGRAAARPEARAAARPEARPAARPEARPAARPEAHPAARPATRPAARPEVGHAAAPHNAARPAPAGHAPAGHPSGGASHGNASHGGGDEHKK